MNADQYIRYYGVYSLPYGGVPEWRDLVFQLGRLYRDRVATIPWLPKEWESVVMPAMMGNGPFYMIAPSTANYAVDGKVVRGAQFLDTPEKKKVWDEIAATANKIHQDYAAGQVEAGRKEMEQAYNNIQFWNSAIKLTDMVAAPVNALVDASEFYAKYRGIISTVMIFGAIGLVYSQFRHR